MKKGSYESALLILNRLIENGSNNFWVYAYRAVCLENNKDYDGALRDYFKAKEIDPEKGKEILKINRLMLMLKREIIINQMLCIINI